MIKNLLLVILVVIILVLSWKIFFTQMENSKERKVKFSKNVEEIKENFSGKPNYEKIKNDLLKKAQKKYDQINPANFYTQDYNTPNFPSDNNPNFSYYAYDLPPNGPSKSIPTEPFNEPTRFPPTDQQIKEDQARSTPWNITPPVTPKGLEYQDDYWSYKNEFPMNGGDFGGIVGYENMGDSFSLFYSKNTNDIVEDQENMLRPTDDLRNGMGVPQKQKYNYNMAMP